MLHCSLLTNVRSSALFGTSQVFFLTSIFLRLPANSVTILLGSMAMCIYIKLRPFSLDSVMVFRRSDLRRHNAEHDLFAIAEETGGPPRLLNNRRMAW